MNVHEDGGVVYIQKKDIPLMFEGMKNQVDILEKEIAEMDVEGKIKEWIEEICHKDNWDRFVVFQVFGVGENEEKRIKVRIFTNKCEYYIKVSPNAILKLQDDKGYMECICYSKTEVDDKVGINFSSGPINRKIWERIKNDILGNELFKIK